MLVEEGGEGASWVLSQRVCFTLGLFFFKLPIQRKKGVSYFGDTGLGCILNFKKNVFWRFVSTVP